MARTESVVGTVVLVWSGLVLLAAFGFGVVPRTWLGVLLLVSLGPIAWLLGELCLRGAGSIAPVASLHERVSGRTAHRKVSVLRIAVMLFEAAVALAIIGGIGLLLDGTFAERWIEAAGPFWSRHFR